METTIAMIAIFMLLLGATQFFVWANRQLIGRQRAYQNSRVALGLSTGPGIIPGFNYQPQKFNIFKLLPGKQVETTDDIAEAEEVMPTQPEPGLTLVDALIADGAIVAGSGQTITAGAGEIVVALTGGTAVAGSGGTAVAGSGGTAIANDGGTAIANDGGTAIANDGGSAIAAGGTAIANEGGTVEGDTGYDSQWDI
ncbi:MAG: hypothetical protein JW714_01105 [Candidatus Omnitrophica bacterium]|nr:hypothetical protein [Candidatus Omnitrophota bacterium]